MFTVYLKQWHNNWSEPVEEYPFDDFEAARGFADVNNTLDVEDIGNNCYVNNGCQTWVEDFTGKMVYEPLV